MEPPDEHGWMLGSDGRWPGNHVLFWEVQPRSEDHQELPI